MQDGNKRTKTKLIIILFVSACLISYLIYKLTPGVLDYISGYDKEYINKMKAIQVGMCEKDVISILGKPNKVITDPVVRLTHGKYGTGLEYGKIIRNKNKCYVYFHGTDYVGSYFIDREDKVFFVNVGGT